MGVDRGALAVIFVAGSLRQTALGRKLTLRALAVVIALTGEVSAQGPTSSAPGPAISASPRDAAQAHFQRGLDLAQRQLWDAALAEFMASRELYPTRAASRNAAIALERLGRFAEACHLYEALLRDFGPTMPADQRSTVVTEMEAVIAQTGELEVAPTEGDAAVTIDGKPSPVGSPGVLRVDPGTHEIRADKAGFRSTVVNVTVASRTRQRVILQLRPLSNVGTLVVKEVAGKALKITLDNTTVGTTPWSGDVATGPHLVQLGKWPGQGTAPSLIRIRGGTSTTLMLRALDLIGRLHVEPTPSNAEIYVDGVSVGVGVWEGALPGGRHQLEVIAPGHFTLKRDVELERGELRTIDARLERDRSSALWQFKKPVELRVGLGLGGIWAPTLNGSDRDCGCRSGTPPLGAFALGHLSYGVGAGVSLEIAAGFLSIWERRQRALQSADPLPWRTDRYNDQTRLAGPVALLQVAYRSRGKWFFRSRAGVGFALLRSRTLNSAVFGRQSAQTGEAVELPVAIEERRWWLSTPLTSVELGLGRELSDRWSVIAGAALTLFAPEQRPRTSTDPRFSDGSSRSVGLGRNGGLTLPRQRVTSSFLAVMPEFSVSYRF